MEEKQKKISLTLRVDEELHQKLKLYALRNDTTIQSYIMGLIKQDIEKEQEEVVVG